MRNALALFFPLTIAACSAPPVEVPLADFTVRLEPSPARIVVRSSDGRVLLDGLPGGSVDGEQPHVAAAFRAATPTYQELYGAFNVSENAGAWRPVRRLSRIVPGADGVTFHLDGDASGDGSIRRVADGTLEIELTSTSGNRATAAFRCTPDEHFLGFGAQTFDVDHRGNTVPIWLSEQGIGKVTTDEPPGDWFYRGTRHSTYFPVPFFLSSRGYGVAADTTRRSLFAMCSESTDVWRVEAWEGTLRFHLFAGPAPLDVIRQHTALIGRAPAAPDLAFAPWNDAIMGSQNVRTIAGELRANHIPSSVMWTEDWAGGFANGNAYHLSYEWQADRTLYPDIEQLAAELHQKGFRFFGYFNTFVNTDSPRFTEGTSGNFLVRDASGAPYLLDGPLFKKVALVDLTSTAAQGWMGGFMKQALALGLDGWMADYGEWLPADALLASGEDPEAAHQKYPLAWQALNASVLGEARADGTERLDFVRSGYEGSQAAPHQVVWGGDQNTEFSVDDGLPTVLPIALGLGVSGVPYFGSDIGGYLSRPNMPHTTKELFFRWSALGALSPVMRTHHGSEPLLNWHFDSDAETLAHFRRWASFHLRLLPYFRAQAKLAAATGAPIMRALGVDFPDDAQAWTTADEYLLGPSLLAAPVVQMGTSARSVYLPAGRWLPFAPERPGAPPVDGPTMIMAQAPVGELPLYARAGTILLLLPSSIETVVPAQGIDLAGSNAREVIAFAGADGSFAEDGAASYALSGPGGAPTAGALSWAGQPLTACAATPAAPCGAIDLAAREAVAQVNGDGVLVLSDGAQPLATLTVSGAAARPHTLRLRF